MHVVSLIIVRARTAVTPFVTPVYAVFILELFSSSVSIVPVSLRTAVVVVSIIIVPSSIVISGFTVFSRLGSRVRVYVICAIVLFGLYILS